MNVLASISVLALLIFFHEAGHFLAAISLQIRVTGFSIGFGPAIIQKKFREVNYSLRALPLGGYVSFPDNDKESDIPPNDPNLLGNRPIIQRAFVISAGVIANLLLAWLILLGQANFIGIPNQPEPGIIVMSVQEGGSAESSGLISGDRITAINGIYLNNGQKSVQVFVKEIQRAPEQNIDLLTVSNGMEKKIIIKPSNYLGKGKIGAQLQPNSSKEILPAANLLEVFNTANHQFMDLLVNTVNGYKSLITNFGSTAEQLSGPVKIVEIGAQLSKEGGTGLLLFASLISINLAVLNSLPLPLLDGGQLVFILLEGIRGKPVPERIQLVFMQSGFILLVGLSVVLIIRDTTQLSMVQQLIHR